MLLISYSMGNKCSYFMSGLNYSQLLQTVLIIVVLI